MDSLFQNHSGEKSEHPPRELLLLFVDGELPTKDAAQMETHLEACWPCRVKTQKIQDAIAGIIEFDDQVLTARLVPPGGWRNFNRQLGQLAAASGKQSLSSKLFGSIARFFPVARFSEAPQRLLRPAMVRNFAAILLLILVAALLFRFRHEPVVSASELLNHAIEAQAQQIQAKTDPVVHQRLKVVRTDPSRESEVSLEIWRDAKNGRVRQFLADGDRSIPAAANAPASNSKDLINELTQALKANQMDPGCPLSAASYQSWRNTLHEQRDQITRSKLADGIEVLTLRTIPAGTVNVGQIAEAFFVVRAADWLPTELRLNVMTDKGNHVYDLTQTISEVVSLAQIDPAILAGVPAGASPTNASTREIGKKETEPSPALAPNPLPLTPTPASAELEVEALRLLNQAGADLGEQITVKRNSTGLLEVSGVVESDRRKTEIISALNPIAGNPSVHLDIQTVSEALAKQKQKPSTSSKAKTTEGVEIQGAGVAAEPQLRAYFERRGGNVDAAVRHFAASMVSQSGQAMQHLGAMKRLANQFSAEQLRTITPDARLKWLELLRAHARAYQQQSAGLRRELRPIFFPNAGEEAAGVSAIRSDEELKQAVLELFNAGAANDQVIRSAFTATSEAARFTAIGTPQFWQAMKKAEALAARIQSGQ